MLNWAGGDVNVRIGSSQGFCQVCKRPTVENRFASSPRLKMGAVGRVNEGVSEPMSTWST